MRKPYPTDLSDAEWSCLESHLPAPKATGRPRIHCPREILNAIFFYVLRSGCPWRLLPHDFPTVEDGLSLLQDSANIRYLGEDQPGDPRTFAGSLEEESATQRRHSG